MESRDITKYINKNLPDKIKKEIGSAVFMFLVEYSGSKGSTPEEFLSKFEKSKVDFLLTCLKLSMPDIEYNYNSILPTDEENILIDEILCFIASYCILKDLKEGYFKNNIKLIDSKINIITFPDEIKSDFYMLNLDNVEDILNFYNKLVVRTVSDTELEVQIQCVVIDSKSLEIAFENFRNILLFRNYAMQEIQSNILQVVSKIKQRLKLLYSGLYNSKAAILYNSNSGLTIESINGEDIFNNIRIDEYISSVVDTWSTVRGKNEVDLFYGNGNDISDPNILLDMIENIVDKEKVYLPYFHLYNLRKGKDWVEEYLKKDGIFETCLIQYLNTVDRSNFSKVVDSLLLGLTQFLALTSVNRHTFLIRGSYFIIESLDGIITSQWGNSMWTNKESPFYKTFQINSEKYVKGSLNNTMTIATLLQEDQKDSRDIITITYIYNKKMYEKENLFAYKLYSGENSITSSLLEPVIGVKLDGSLYRKNIFSRNFTNIIAGSRSGKGTLTMSLIAPLLIAKQPIVYLDNKADIAALFWNLENQINKIWGENTLHFLAIDALSQEAEGEKDRPGRVYRSLRNANMDNLINIPSIFSEKDADWLKLIRNIKLLQLFLLMGYIEPVKGNLLKNTTYIFIDEITNYFNRLNKYLYRTLDLYKDDSANVELHNYLDRISIMIDSINNDFGILFGTMKGKRWSKFKFISIGQTLKLDDWEKAGTVYTNGNKKYSRDIGSAVKTPFGYALSSNESVTWLSGKGQGVLEDYDVSDVEAEFLDGDTGVPGSFIVHTQKPRVTTSYPVSKYELFQNSAKKTIKDYTFIRTYFVLVSNDITSEDVEIIQSKLQEGEKVLGDYLESQKYVKYTYMFLNNVYLGAEKDGMVTECINTALNDIYDFKNNEPIKEVGFDGLLEVLLKKEGIDIFDTSCQKARELFNEWNRVYDVLFSVVTNMFPDKYNTLEDYLFDVSPESICSTDELNNKYTKAISKKEKKQRTINQRFQEIAPDLEGLDPEKKEEKLKEIEKSVEEEIAREEAEEVQNLGKEREKVISEIIEKVKPHYRVSIRDAENGLIDLITISKKDKKEEDFNKKKITLLRNDLPGKFEVQKNEFLMKGLVKVLQDLNVIDESVQTEVIQRYEKIYTMRLSEIYEQINSMEYGGNNAPLPTNPKVKTGEDTGGEGNVGEGNVGEEEEGVGETPNLVPQTQDPPHRPTGINHQRITASINTENLVYDVDTVDKVGNAVAINEIAEYLIKDIRKQFGGINNIDSIGITSSGCLVINNYAYTPQFSETFMNSLSKEMAEAISNGCIIKVTNMGKLVKALMKNCFSLSIETPIISTSVLFKRELGIRYSYGELFKRHPNLQEIYLPDEELTRNSPERENSGGFGIGAKIASIFNIGGNKGSSDYIPDPKPEYNGNTFIDRAFESKPVRILTGALGWTLGCKAVVLAATLFGPWGLLFGGLAAAGAYKEIKNERNNNGYSSTRGSGSSGQRKKSSGSSQSGQKQRQKKQNEED